jgi:hypothetical protein
MDFQARTEIDFCVDEKVMRAKGVLETEGERERERGIQ